ncbi:MAG: HepT-like ribonuclease domain-containing protein [Cyanobium sp.]
MLVHQYDRISFNTLWDVIQQDIPQLLSLLVPLLPNAQRGKHAQTPVARFQGNTPVVKG